MTRKPDRREEYVIADHMRIAVDYMTTQQFGGRGTRAESIRRACFFSIGAPGKCMHYVMDLPNEAEGLPERELAKWLAKNFRSAQHIRTCNVVGDP